MADQLTLDSGLVNDIFVAADVVGRELNGFIPSVTMNAESTRASKGDNITAAFTRAASAFDITENMQVPEANETVTVDSKTLTLTKARQVQIPLGGEDTRQLQNTGQYATVYGDLITQAMRTLANEMEVEIATALKQNASYATGVQGVTPFVVDSTSESGVEELLKARRVLVDSGMPTDDVSAVLNTTAGANIRSNLKLLDAGFAGTTDLRSQGILLPIAGINLRESGNITAHTAGTAAATGLIKAVDNAGSTSILIDSLDDGGTILAGDILETNTQDVDGIYSVVGQESANDFTYTAGSAGAGANELTVNLNGGLKLPTADNEEVRFLDYTPNFVFHRAAVELAMRAPAMPVVGDAATDAITVQDPHSGLVFEVRTYAGYHKAMIEVAAVFGVKVWKGEFAHIILG